MASVWVRRSGRGRHLPCLAVLGESPGNVLVMYFNGRGLVFKTVPRVVLLDYRCIE